MEKVSVMKRSLAVLWVILLISYFSSSCQRDKATIDEIKASVEMITTEEGARISVTVPFKIQDLDRVTAVISSDDILLPLSLLILELKAVE